MSDAKSFQCPNCGSSVQTDGTQKEVKCDYCGTTVIVPEELRDQPAPVHASAPMEMKFEAYTPAVSDEVAKSIGTAAKVTVGVTAVSFILPIILTCVILAFVGGVLFFVFSNVNKSITSAIAPISSLQTEMPTFVPDTAVPTDSPTPINTPTPYTKVLLKDNFSNPSSGWNKTQSPDYTLEYKKGKYHVLINKQNGGQVLWVGSKYTDMSIEVDIQQTAGPTDGEIGVACRPNDSGGFYAFEFNQDGQYGIYKSTNWNSTALAEGTLDPNTISTASITHIEGICQGSNLTLLLNGQALLQAQDSDYTQGGLGLIVTAGNSGDPGVDVLFSNFLAKGP